MMLRYNFEEGIKYKIKYATNCTLQYFMLQHYCHKALYTAHTCYTHNAAGDNCLTAPHPAEGNIYLTALPLLGDKGIS